MHKRKRSCLKIVYVWYYHRLVRFPVTNWLLYLQTHWLLYLQTHWLLYLQTHLSHNYWLVTWLVQSMLTLIH